MHIHECPSSDLNVLSFPLCLLQYHGYSKGVHYLTFVGHFIMLLQAIWANRLHTDEKILTYYLVCDLVIFYAMQRCHPNVLEVRGSGVQAVTQKGFLPSMCYGFEQLPNIKK